MVNPYEPARYCEPRSVDQGPIARQSFRIALGGMFFVSAIAAVDAFVVSRATGTAILCSILSLASMVPLLFSIWMMRGETRFRQLVVRIFTVVIQVFSVTCYTLYLLRSDVPNLRNSSQVHIFVFPMVPFVLSTIIAIAACWFSFLFEQSRSEVGKEG